MRIGLKLQQFLIRNKNYKAEIEYNGEKFRIILKKPQRVLFGCIILQPEKIIKTRFLEEEIIEYVEEYKDFIKKCFDENPTGNKLLDLLNLTLAINTEAGEYGDIIKKAVYFSKPTKKSDICDELGDIMYYLINTLTFFDLDLKDVMMCNMIKIKERYPNGREKNYFHNIRNKKEEKRKLDEFFENLNKNEDIDVSYQENKEKQQDKNIKQ